MTIATVGDKPLTAAEAWRVLENPLFYCTYSGKAGETMLGQLAGQPVTMTVPALDFWRAVGAAL